MEAKRNANVVQLHERLKEMVDQVDRLRDENTTSASEVQALRSQIDKLVGALKAQVGRRGHSISYCCPGRRAERGCSSGCRNAMTCSLVTDRCCAQEEGHQAALSAVTTRLHDTERALTGRTDELGAREREVEQLKTLKVSLQVRPRARPPRPPVVSNCAQSL